MAHIALVSPPLRGHMDPMNALGEELARRRHRVTWFVEPEASGMVAPALRDVALPLAPEAGAFARLAERGGERGGTTGARGAVHAMAARCEALCGILPEAFSRAGVDAIICDQTEPAGALAAMACGLPHASVAAALPLNREPGVPPPYVDWAHRADGSRDWLYRGGHRVTDILMRPLSRAIRARALAFGLKGMETLEDTFSADLQLLQIPRALDFPRRALPAAAHHVGPLRRREDDPFDFAANGFADDGRPLAFCSLGSLQGGRFDLFERFAAALSQAGLRPVIAHGGRLSSADAARLPGDPIVAAFLPQRAVLARCRLAATHGGMNTVIDALAAGAPLVVTPLAYEQGAIAARVGASGAGLVVKPRGARGLLQKACRALLDDPSFAANARRIADDIASAGGVARAGQLVDAWLSAAAPAAMGFASARQEGRPQSGPGAAAAGQAAAFSTR